MARSVWQVMSGHKTVVTRGGYRAQNRVFWQAHNYGLARGRQIQGRRRTPWLGNSPDAYRGGLF